jgi:hypothetical protein
MMPDEEQLVVKIFIIIIWLGPPPIGLSPMWEGRKITGARSLPRDRRLPNRGLDHSGIKMTDGWGLGPLPQEVLHPPGAPSPRLPP